MLVKDQWYLDGSDEMKRIDVKEREIRIYHEEIEIKRKKGEFSARVTNKKWGRMAKR